MKKAIIFGAGEWGKIAFFYYKEKCDLECYIDNDDTRWGEVLNGLKICPPDILRTKQYKIIIANKRHEKEIEIQLRDKYFVNEVIFFRMEEKFVEIKKNTLTNSKDELIVAFRGGLGNQMFQYALYRNFLNQGKNVTADLSSYIALGVMPFQLETVFPHIRLKKANPGKKEQYLNDEKNLTYIEPDIWHTPTTMLETGILEMKKGYIDGYHQIHIYADLMRDILKKEFTFIDATDNGFVRLCKEIKRDEYVGVHVRRGDYMEQKYKRLFGGICAEKYYDSAIELMKNRYGKKRLIFFSNDMEWVKGNMKYKDAIYVEEQFFDDYHDWYDMCLMSLCKHNIIANSSFSWWGAWLNDNPEKIVIAPQRWTNAESGKDNRCPKSWIRI